MLRLLSLLLLSFWLPDLCFASQDNPTRDELLQTVRHMQQLADNAISENEQTKLQLKSTQDALTFANSALDDSKNQFSTYQKAAETEIAKGNSAIASLAALVKKHHLDLMILCGLWVGFVALLYMKAGTILGPVGVYVAAGIGAAGVGMILWRL